MIRIQHPRPYRYRKLFTCWPNIKHRRVLNSISINSQSTFNIGLREFSVRWQSAVLDTYKCSQLHAIANILAGSGKSCYGAGAACRKAIQKGWLIFWFAKCFPIWKICKDPKLEPERCQNSRTRSNKGERNTRSLSFFGKIKCVFYALKEFVMSCHVSSIIQYRCILYIHIIIKIFSKRWWII